MRNLFLLSCLAFLITGCYQARKSQFDASVSPLQHLVVNEDSILSNLRVQAEDKLQSQAIDTANHDLIIQKIETFQKRTDSLRMELAILQTIADNRKSLRKNYRKFVATTYDSLANIVQDTASTEKRYQVYGMLQDALTSARQNLFYLAAFFGPGEFTIPDSSFAFVDSMFAPLVDSLISFNNRYKDVEKVATLSFYGYADGQPIAMESALEETLRALTTIEGSSSAALNLALSHLRSQAMSKAIHQMLAKRKGEFLRPERLHLIDVIQGKGEAYPNPSITNYQLNDERRRIVLFYWSVLPK